MPGIRTRRVSWLNYWWLAYLQVSTYSKIFNFLYSLQWFSLVNQMHFIINLLKYSWEFRCFVFHFVCIVLLELSWFIPVSRKLFLLTINSVCKNRIKLSLIFFFISVIIDNYWCLGNIRVFKDLHCVKSVRIRSYSG